MSVQDIIAKMNQLLTIDNAKNLLEQAKTSAPSRDEINTAVAALQDTMENIKQKSLQGASSATTIYQQTINSPQIETLVARIYGSRTPEERQRELEKILYIYLLKFGAEQTPSVDIDVMTSQETDAFLDNVLKPDTPAKDAVTEMVRSLMLLFFGERMGSSVVEYGMEFSNKDMDAMYKTIIDERRLREISESVDKNIKNKEFMEFFLKQIIKDVPDKVSNDAKYFGHIEDYAKNMRVKVNNFIKAHNTYVSTYLKDGGTLVKEIAKLDRLVLIMQETRNLVEDKHEIDELLRLLASMREALTNMVNASKGNEIKAYEFKPLVDILDATDDDEVIQGPEIVKKREKRRREEEGEENPPKRPRSNTPVMDSQESDIGGPSIGGRRRRTRKTQTKRKRRSIRRKRKGGTRKSRSNRKKGTTKRKRAGRRTKRR